MTKLSFLFYAALILGGIYLVFRFALPWFAPFIFALLTARLIEPLVKFLVRKWKFKRGIASIICSLFVLAAMIAFVALLVSWAVSGLTSFARSLPDLAEQFSETVTRIEMAVYRFTIAAPVETQEWIGMIVEGANESFAEIPSQISAWLIARLANAAATFPRIIVFLITYAIGVIFISVSFTQVTGFLGKQIPPRFRERVREFRGDMASTLLKWCKAQLMLMSVTFVILTIAFLILRVPYGILFALLIALIDALPVLGTGAILIPWALVRILNGDLVMGVSLLILWGIVSVVHSFLEPRFVGDQLGLHPVATLVAMYAGFSAVGVVGMILFPVLLILLKQFHDRGHLKLWK